MPKNKEVDVWMSRYENPMKPVVQRIRAIVLGADKRMTECIKWQAPTFTYQGNLASFFPKAKQHASLMFHEGARIPGKHPRLTGGGGTGRMLKIASLAEANAAKKDIEAIVRAWCAWRDASGKAGARKSATPKLAKKTTKKLAKATAKAKATKKPAKAAKAKATKKPAKAAARRKATQKPARTRRAG